MNQLNPLAADGALKDLEMDTEGEVLSLHRLDDLPAGTNVDKKTWIEWGIRSNK